MGWPPADQASTALSVFTAADIARYENRLDARFAALQQHIDHKAPDMPLAFMAGVTIGLLAGVVLASIR